MAENSIFERIGNWVFGTAPEPEPEMAAPEIFDIETGADIAKAKAVPTTTLGSTSILDLGGYLYTEERVPDLLGERRFRTYDAMVKDTAIVAAGVRLFLNLLANAEWSVNPPEGQEENPQAQDIAAQCYDILFDMTSSWSTVVRKTALYRFQGFAILEWTAKKRSDGAIGLMDVENRPQRSIVRWLRDKSGTVEAVVQRLVSAGEVVLPRAKVIYAVDDTLTDSPEGMGLFRHLAPTSDRLRQFLELELIGFETDLRGVPIARAPLGELQKEVKEAEGPAAKAQAEAKRVNTLKPVKDFLQKHIKNMKTGVLLPSDTYTSLSQDSKIATATPKWALELLTGESTSFDAIAKAIVRMNEELARILGVEHLLLGAGGSGSLALAQSKVGTFYLTLTSTLLDLIEIYERDLIEPLAQLNAWPEELIPTMGVSEISEMDIEMVTRSLASLATAGATLLPTDKAVAEVYDRLGLTPPDPADHEMDASLNPGRTAPTDPNAPIEGAPEDKVAKRRILKNRSTMARQARAAAMRKAA